MKASAAFVCGLAVAAGCRARWDGVLTALSDPDARVRAEAVRRVGLTGNPDDLSSLILRANDPAPEVRGAIAQALGALDNAQSSDALAALVTDEADSVQLEAAAALARHRDPRAHHYLLLAYQHDGPLVRARIADLLKAGGGSPAEAVSAEAAALYAKYSEELAGSGAERLIAAELLGSSGRPEAIGRLTSYLGAESRSLAMAAARGLGASGSPEARAPLEALLNEDDPGLRLAGAEALGELGDPQAALALSRAIQQNDVASRAALRSLARLAQLKSAASKPPTPVADLLCGVVLGPDPDLSRAAATAIQGLGATCPVERLKARVVRGGAVSGVLAGIAVLWSKTEPGGKELDRGRLSAALGSLLRTGSAQVRPLAARAIGALGISQLDGDLERARKEAGLELERARERWIKAGGALPSLFSPDPPAAVALWAETSLARLRLSLKDSSLSAALMAQDPAPAIRVAAAQAVPWSPTDKQWEILEPLLGDSDSAVREAARAVLPNLDLKAVSAGAWLLNELRQPHSAADGEADDAPLAEALSHLAGLPGMQPSLVEALDHPDTAPAAARALAVGGGSEAWTAILSHLQQPFALALPELLEAIADHAARTEQDSDRAAAAGACRALLFHSRPEVRAAAVRALKAIEGASAAAEVQPLAVDYDVRVRRAVASP